MSYVTTYPLRKTVRYFGQDCQIEKLAHSAIEHARLETENNILRSECARWKIQAQEAMANRGEIALRLAEIMERESALVAAIAQHEAIEKLRRAQLERADMIQTAQRLRIDELSRLNAEYCGDIERLEEVVAKLRTELAAVLGPGGMEILRCECDA